MPSNEKGSSVWWGTIILVISCLFLFIVTLLSGPTKFVEAYQNLYAEYSGTVSAYNSLRDVSMGIINSCGNPSSAECSTAIDIVKNTIPVLPANAIPEETLSLWRQYSNVVVFILLGGLSILLITIQAYQFQQKSTLREKQFVRERQQAIEDGRREIIRSIALELVSDKDVISELAIWLTQYKSGSAKIDQSAHIHNQMLTRLVKQIHLNPISKINDVVAFNPDQHNTYDRLKPSEEAIVIEPGWRVGREIIKPPLVRRKS